MEKKKILVIDDSALMRRVISDIINADGEMEVARIARNGLEGYEVILAQPGYYDAIVMDINMPKMTGLEVMERLVQDGIRETIVVASTVAKEGAEETIRALELGAFDFVTKPETGLFGKDSSFQDRILEIVKTAAMSPKRRTAAGAAARAAGMQKKTRPAPEPAVTVSRKTGGIRRGGSKLVALACSTGGPKALQSVIPKLPANLDAPVLVVQHMPRGFTVSLAKRLDEMSAVHVKEAEDGEILKKGTIYIAQGGRHLLAAKDGNNLKIVIQDSPPVDALKPCANLMYDSLKNIPVDEITCVVLTGMGADGTRGITSLARYKKVHVIAQNEETCVVYGMPRAIYEAGIVDEVCPLEAVADAITNNVGVS